MPAATAAFVEPFADELLPLDLRAFPPLREDALRLREDALRLRDDAADVRRLDELPLFALLRDAVDLLLPLLLLRLPLLLLDPLRLFGLDPFELREPACRLLPERVFAWAMAPP